MRHIYLLSLLLFGSQVFAQKQVMLKDCNPFGNSYPSSMLQFNSHLYFSAVNSVDGDNRALWKTDGTSGGTVLVKASSTGNFSPSYLTISGNKFFFVNYTNSGSYSNLWVSDGSTTGTRQVITTNQFGSDEVRNLTDVNGKFFYTATDNMSGQELWTSDGTTAGTTMVKDIAAGLGAGSYPRMLIPYNNKLYFFAEATTAIALWSSDGTSAGTTSIKSFSAYPGASIEGITAWNGSLFFFIKHNTGFDLWKSDGTNAGTVRIHQYTTGLLNDYGLNGFVPYNGRLYFMADPDGNGGEVWSTDGTIAGTTMLKDITSGFTYGNYPVTIFNGKLVVIAMDDVYGQEIFLSDGTAAGTTLLKDINPTGDSDPEGYYFFRIMKIYNNRLYFNATDGVQGSQMYSTDGTAAGTFKHTPDNLPYINPSGFIQDTFKNSLYFSAEYDGNGIELYQFTDSTFLTGIKNISNNSAPVGLYPNPARTQVTVSYTLPAPGDCTITITDVTGKAVYTKTEMQVAGKHEQLVQLPAGISTGIYQVRLVHAQFTTTCKLVVE